MCFDIEFNNLAPQELELLLTAIEPDTNYKHQVGMAKPYGYGQINVDITSISLIDKTKRYLSFTDTGEAPLWQAGSSDSNWSEWLRQQTDLSAQNPLIDEVTLYFVRQVGNPENYDDKEIGYPSSEGNEASIFS